MKHLKIVHEVKNRQTDVNTHSLSAALLMWSLSMLNRHQEV